MANLFEREFDRRSILAAMAAGAVVAACGIPEGQKSTAPDKNSIDKSLPIKDEATHETAKIITSVEITSKNLVFIYPNEISTEEWSKISLGKDLPLPLGSGGLPIKADTLTRRIKAGSTYKEWAGRDIVDKMIGFQFHPGAEITTICDGSMRVLPDGNDPHSRTTTRLLLRQVGSRIGYVYLVGGKNHDWITQISRSSTDYTRVKAGQPILTVNTPSRVIAEYYEDIIENIPSVYNMILTQVTLPEPGGPAISIFREQDGVVTSSQLSVDSLKKNPQGMFTGLYTSGGK